MSERAATPAASASASVSATTSGSIGTIKKPHRPPILKRPSQHSPRTTSGALLGSPRKERVVLEPSQPGEDMAVFFQNYCAMCERVITHPDSSLLYCSESCKRKDSAKPLSAANLHNMATSPLSPPASPSSTRPILAPRRPTGTDSPAIRIPADNHAFKSDLDPTEWKPKGNRRAGGRPTANRYNSEAFRYLSSFHRSINRNNDNDTPDDIRIEVPDMSMTAPTTPSLGNTPTTTASSWSISTSDNHYAGRMDGAYDTRPLAIRHNRWYSTSVINSNGLDLVTPHIPPPVNPFEKKNIMIGGETPKGGIGGFFGAGMD